MKRSDPVHKTQTKPLLINNKGDTVIEMQPQRWQDKQISLGNLVRQTLILIVILLILGIGTIYLISVLVSPNPSVGMAAIFSAILLVLSVLFAFIQIIFASRTAIQTPLPSMSSPASNSPLDKDNAAWALFRKEVENDLQYQPDQGAIIIITIEQMLNKQIVISNYITNTIEQQIPVVTRIYNGYTIYIVKALMAPGVYKVTCPTGSRLAIRTVQIADIAKGQVTEFDWRR